MSATVRPRHHSGGSPGSATALRSANSRRVLDALRAARADAGAVDTDATETLTQADLARATGLAPATVSSIVRELTAAGVLETDPGSGRRGTKVRLSHGTGVVAGVDFGHSHVGVALGDLAGNVLVHRRVAMDADHHFGEGLDRAARLLEEVLDVEGRAHGDVQAVGLGLPVPLFGGAVRSTAILPGWTGLDPQRLAEERFRCPVHVDNDANLGALAEHRQGVARGHSDIVFIKVASGIGAGIIVGNQLLRGSSGTAGELGHLTLDDQGPVCRCGSRGCLEAYVSTSKVKALLADQLPDASLTDIIEAAHGGNVAARRALEDTGLHLGWGVASLVNLLNPGLVIIGGEMAAAGELLLEPVRSALRRHALDTVAGTPVAASDLGAMASQVGAVIIAAERTELVSA